MLESVSVSQSLFFILYVYLWIYAYVSACVCVTHLVSVGRCICVSRCLSVCNNEYMQVYLRVCVGGGLKRNLCILTERDILSNPLR